MNADNLLEILLTRCEEKFEIEKNYAIEGYSYAAFASHPGDDGKYLLFDLVDVLDEEHLHTAEKHIKNVIEPQLVRGGEKYPSKTHVRSEMAVFFLCSGGMTKGGKSVLERSKFYRNYLFDVYGCSELLFVAVDLAEGHVYANKAAKKLKQILEEKILK